MPLKTNKINKNKYDKEVTKNVSFFTLIFIAFQILYFSFFEITNYISVYYVLFFIILWVYSLNKLNYTLLAKIIYFFAFNGYITFFSIVYGKNASVEFFFTASLAMTFFIFSFNKEKTYVYFFSFLIFFLWLFLYLTDFTPFNIETIAPINNSILYINVFILLLLTIIIQLRYYTNRNINIYNNNQKLRASAIKNSTDKIEFLNTMSHEIRTPLNAINGLTFILKKNKPENHQIENIKSLEVNGANVMRLLNNVLDFSKYQSDKIFLDITTLNIYESLKEKSKLYEEHCKEKDLTFILAIEEDLPIVNIDSTKFENLLDNLVYNAINATSQGQIKLSITKIKNKTDKNITLNFEIKDTGIGLSQEKQKILLNNNIYYHNNSNSYKKVGLGLSIVKSILTLMKSELKIKSELELGSIFSFTITLEKAKITHTQKQNTLPNLDNLNLKNKNILIVDDNKINILVAKQCLLKEGLIISEASNGLEAVELTKNKSFDIILMDIQMPVMDGFEATEKIREFNTKVPIIALSASVLDNIKYDIEKHGLNGLILKPFKPEELIATIKNEIGYE